MNSVFSRRMAPRYEELKSLYCGLYHNDMAAFDRPRWEGSYGVFLYSDRYRFNERSAASAACWGVILPLQQSTI